MFETALANLDVEAFWRDGWAVLPDVYSPEEVETMRREALEHNENGGGELATSTLKHVLTDGRMTATAAKLLGTDKILYGGDSSATINGVIRVWHKDNTDRQDPAAPDWDDRYTQLRFGVYLQDHTEHTGGLNLKTGAHEFCDLTSGPTVYVRNNPGDLLVWSMRMTHSGAGTLLKDPSKPDPEPSEWNKFPADEIAPAHDNRIAVFVHLGANDKHGRRYLDYLKTRTYVVSGWRQRPWSDELIEELTASGLIVRNLPEEVADDPRAGLSKQWEPFWYPGKPVESAKPAKPATPAATKPAATTPPTKAAPAASAAPAQQSARKRYSRAVKRRLKGIGAGAVQGWHDAAPAPTRAARAAAQKARREAQAGTKATPTTGM